MTVKGLARLVGVLPSTTYDHFTLENQVVHV
jgi:hypothetical protein